jgi:hypothetical protein
MSVNIKLMTDNDIYFMSNLRRNHLQKQSKHILNTQMTYFFP